MQWLRFWCCRTSEQDDPTPFVHLEELTPVETLRENLRDELDSLKERIVSSYSAKRENVITILDGAGYSTDTFIKLLDKINVLSEQVQTRNNYPLPVVAEKIESLKAARNHKTTDGMLAALEDIYEAFGFQFTTLSKIQTTRAQHH